MHRARVHERVTEFGEWSVSLLTFNTTTRTRVLEFRPCFYFCAIVAIHLEMLLRIRPWCILTL